MQVFFNLSHMYQEFKTCSGKSEMLPLYQDKKAQVQNHKKTPFLVSFFYFSKSLNLFLFWSFSFLDSDSIKSNSLSNPFS